MRKSSLSALVAAGLLAGGLSAGSASAADLGGNCCADLEERIAELEATTARKGNRKVSLTISGWVGEQVMWWDDGAEQNVYVTGLGSTLASNVKFTGQATIAPGWYAGYVIHLEMIDSDSLTINQFQQQGPNAVNGGNQNVTTLQSFWFLKSDHLGKVGIGKQSSASDNAAILVDSSGSLVPANWVLFDFNGFFLRSKSAGLLTTGTGAVAGLNWQAFGGYCQTGGGAGGDCFGVPQQAIRYDSPTYAGFSVSAAWGGDDFWDVAARYAGEYNGIKIAAAAAYTEYSGNFWFGNGQQYGAAPSIIANSDDSKNMKYFQVGATWSTFPRVCGSMVPTAISRRTVSRQQPAHSPQRLVQTFSTQVPAVCRSRLPTPTTSRVVFVSAGPIWATPYSTVSTPSTTTVFPMPS